MRRTLPTAQETVRILASRRPRPLPAPPPAAGRALTPTLKALETRFGQGADGLKARWRDIVGADLARHTEPTRLVKARSPGAGDSRAVAESRDGEVTAGRGRSAAPDAPRQPVAGPRTEIARPNVASQAPPEAKSAARNAAGPKRPLLAAPAVREGATLELRVEGPSAAIIQHRAADIISRVNLYLGAGAVARLRIVQGPLRGPARQSAPSPAANPRRFKAPLDAAAEQALATALEGFTEGPLKAALARLGREVMRQAEQTARR